MSIICFARDLVTVCFIGVSVIVGCPQGERWLYWFLIKFLVTLFGILHVQNYWKFLSFDFGSSFERVIQKSTTMNLYYISWLFLLSRSDVEIASHFVDLKGTMDSTSIKGFVFILTSSAKGTSKRGNQLIDKCLTTGREGWMHFINNRVT